MCKWIDAVLYPTDLIESEIRDNLRAKITDCCGSKIKIDLLYKGKVISDNTCEIIIDK